MYIIYTCIIYISRAPQANGYPSNLDFMRRLALSNTSYITHIYYIHKLMIYIYMYILHIKYYIHVYKIHHIPQANGYPSNLDFMRRLARAEESLSLDLSLQRLSSIDFFQASEREGCGGGGGRRRERDRYGQSRV